MRINIKSNFDVPGIDNKESVDLDRPKLTLEEFLKEPSGRAPIHVEYATFHGLSPDPFLRLVLVRQI